jgi:hypothetical protein
VVTLMHVVASDAETLRRTLEGRAIVSYEADEMALWERGPDGLPVFADLQVPCVQCGSITIGFEDGTRLCIHTNLFGYEWGLIVTDFDRVASELEVHRDPYSIYRKATLEHFPAGSISRVAVTVNPDGSFIRAFSLEFEQGAVTLLAGEFEEQFDDGIRLMLDDESILFFPNGDGLAWAEAQVARGHIYGSRRRRS